MVLYGRSVGPTLTYVDVPLFVVVRGAPLEGAAVIVRHNGTTWYIPQPDFGSPTEERSLQTLDLVVQTVQGPLRRNGTCRRQYHQWPSSNSRRLAKGMPVE
jgi:hypothetical protein